MKKSKKINASNRLFRIERGSYKEKYASMFQKQDLKFPDELKSKFKMHGLDEKGRREVFLEIKRRLNVGYLPNTINRTIGDFNPVEALAMMVGYKNDLENRSKGESTTQCILKELMGDKSMPNMDDMEGLMIKALGVELTTAVLFLNCFLGFVNSDKTLETDFIDYFEDRFMSMDGRLKPDKTLQKEMTLVHMRAVGTELAAIMTAWMLTYQDKSGELKQMNTDVIHAIKKIKKEK